MYFVFLIQFLKGQIFPRFIVFLITLIFIYLLGKLLMKHGFSHLSIYRIPSEEGISEGEEFHITTVIENRKRQPLPFVLIEEQFATDMWAKPLSFTHQYRVGKKERLKKINTFKPPKRGVYLVRYMDVTLGDAFGFFTKGEQSLCCLDRCSDHFYRIYQNQLTVLFSFVFNYCSTDGI